MDIIRFSDEANERKWHEYKMSHRLVDTVAAISGRKYHLLDSFAVEQIDTREIQYRVVPETDIREIATDDDLVRFEYYKDLVKRREEKPLPPAGSIEMKLLVLSHRSDDLENVLRDYGIQKVQEEPGGIILENGRKKEGKWVTVYVRKSDRDGFFDDLVQSRISGHDKYHQIFVSDPDRIPDLEESD